MRVRSMSVSLLSAVLLVPAVGVTAHAAGPDQTSAPVLQQSPWKNSVTKRHGLPTRRSGPPVPAPVTPVAPRRAPSPAVSPAQAYQVEVLALTNDERTRRGLRPLAADDCAEGFADRWAVRLAAAGTLAHQPLLPVLRACGARGAAENVAFGNVTPAQLVAMWMASTGHRANILDPGSTHLGAGTVTTSAGRVYAVQVFLTR